MRKAVSSIVPHLYLIVCLFLLQSCSKSNAEVGVVPKDSTDSIQPKDSIYNLSVTNLIQNNMVIQSGKPFKVWGKADANISINVKATWNTEVFSTNSDANGYWEIVIPAAATNNTAQKLTCSVASGKKTVEFNNILIGEVWICSGQSNMVMPLTKISDAYGDFHGVQNYTTEIAEANFPNIRMLTLPTVSSSTPRDNFSNAGSWTICNPTNAAKTNFSAVAYYFARKLHTTLSGNVPIGVIVVAVSATTLEQWSSAESIAEDPITKSYYTAGNASGLYNGMIHPLKNLSIKGFTWFQGESNYTNSPASNYTILHKNMIKGWRNLFNQGVLPFYFVQLPPFGDLSRYTEIHLFGNSLFREAQANVRSLEKTGMACVVDLNEPYNIHSIYKKPVGERLALLALENDYNLSVKSVGPQYKSFSQNGNTVTILLKNAEGLTANGKTSPQLFFVANASDKKFVAASAASIIGNSIELTVPNNITVNAVRYAFTDISIGYITNNAELPLEPFRTDNW